MPICIVLDTAQGDATFSLPWAMCLQGPKPANSEGIGIGCLAAVRLSLRGAG